MTQRQPPIHTPHIDDLVTEQARRSHDDALRDLQRSARANARNIAPPIHIPAALGHSTNATYVTTASSVGGYWGSVTGGSSRVEVPLSHMLQPGDEVRRIRVNIREGNAAGETVSSFVYRIDAGGSNRVFAAPSKASGVRGGDAVLRYGPADRMPFTIQAGYFYLLVIGLAQTSAANECRFYSAVINEALT